MRNAVETGQGNGKDVWEDIVIVVGVDGSQASLVAVEWAAREAAMRGVPIHLVNVVPALDLPAGAPSEEVRRCVHKHALFVLEDALQHVRTGEARTQILTGDPRLGLIKASKDAELLVVGSHGTGGFWQQLAGSVALGTPGQASCPVVVARPLPERPRNEVVVGVDGSSGAEAAMEFAFAEASLRGAELYAVHAWNPVGGDQATSPAGEPDAHRQLLATAVADFRDRFPGVKLVPRLVRGHPVDVLLRASAEAGLLVVGSRGHGPTAVVFGSVSHALVQYAKGPLVVIAVADKA
ncbi:universal stress protein [Nonomuraea sp. NPDC005650]|uniref:universal stress protein n=1 Tax=Nonomuraea sp. NPDC005650 TaxID=3157045 RepID=UPI0033BE6AF4